MFGIKKLFGVKKKSISRPVISASGELGMFTGLYNMNLSPAMSMYLYKQCSALSIPVNWIAEIMASIPLVLKSEEQIITKHECLNLINRPNSYYTRQQFFKILAINYLVTGNSFPVAIGKSSKPPHKLYATNSQYWSIQTDQVGLPFQMMNAGQLLQGTYARNDKLNSFMRDDFTEVKHISNLSTDDKLGMGDSPLVSIINELSQHITGNEHNLNSLKNGGRLSLLFHFKSDLTNEQVTNNANMLRSAYGGSINANKIAVTHGEDLDVQQFGSSNIDMDYIKGQKLLKETIANYYRIPLPLLDGDNMTYNNYETSMTALYDNAVFPVLNELLASLQVMVLDRFKVSDKYKLSYDERMIPVLTGRIWENIVKRKNVNIETTNELRQLVGRDPMGEEADKIYQLASLVPQGEDLSDDASDMDVNENNYRDENNDIVENEQSGKDTKSEDKLK